MARRRKGLGQGDSSPRVLGPEDRKRPIDWFAFTVRFVCGVLFGLFLGVCLWVQFSNGGPGGWWVIPGVAVLVGLASGAWGDAFWHGLRDWLWWYR